MALIAPEIGIDLGTSNTMVYVRGRGIVVSEPTIVVIDSDNKHNVRAVGDEAEILLGRTGDKLVAVRPLKAGSIVNFDMAEILLRYFIRKAIGVSHVIKPKVLVSVPCTLPMVARKAVTEAATLAGAKTVYLIEKPFAAAIGSGLPVYEPIGSMVVDIGGGTTDAAVVSLGGLVVAQSIQVGGMKMDEAIVNYIKKEFQVMIGERTAEDGGRCGRKGRSVMNNRPEIDRYVLTEMDEEGNVWCEYSGKNNFSFHTMTDLLVSFRVFRIAMHVLAFMFGQVVYKLLSQLF